MTLREENASHIESWPPVKRECEIHGNHELWVEWRGMTVPDDKICLLCLRDMSVDHRIRSLSTDNGDEGRVRRHICQCC